VTAAARERAPRRVGAWAAKRMAYSGGVLRLARRARRRDRAIVLRYHAVTGGAGVAYAAPEICMPVDAFRLQMTFVRRAYRVVALDELIDALRDGRSLPAGALAITFDDGYADNHALAAPILHALGLPATVYVATGSLDDRAPFWVAAVRVLALRAGGPVRVRGVEAVEVRDAASRERAARTVTRALVTVDAADRAERIAEAAAQAGVDVRAALAGTMLTSAQVIDLHRQGWAIGAHTVTHGNLAQMDAAVATREIVESRDALAALVSAPVVHFCYPNTGGRHRYFDDEAAAILRRHGFRSATTSQPGAVRPGADPFFLPRLGVSPRLTDVVDLAAAVERQRLVA
jgi:peptidoglycan/xylan/chitin deacetylase (PgdA/CDA1 family)